MKSILTVVWIFTSLFCCGQSEDLMRELNQENFNPNFDKYDPNTALYCGQLSEVVYWKKQAIDDLYSKMMLLYPAQQLKCEFIDNKRTDTQALLWCSSQFLVVAFRGTEPSRIKDILTDTRFWNYSQHSCQDDVWAGMPTGHGGFRSSLKSLFVENNLFEKIDGIIKAANPNANVNEFPIFITGHSLGAGLSQLFMECLDYKKYNFSGAYHFAPPLAIACSAVDQMRAKFGHKVFDIVNYKDYIPRAGRMGVAHYGRFFRICDDKLIYMEPEAYVKFRRIEYFRAFRYHKLRNHLEPIRSDTNSISQIEERSKSSIKFPCMGCGIDEIDPCSVQQKTK